MNRKRLQRLYREERLMVRKRGSRRRDELLNESLFFGIGHAPQRDRGVGGRLQFRSAPLVAGLRDAGGLRQEHRRNRP